MDAGGPPSVVFNLATRLLRQRVTAEGKYITASQSSDRYLPVHFMSHRTRTP